MKIEKLMTHDVYSCSQADSLDTAAQHMWNHDCGALPVTDLGQVVGIITDRDICMAAYTKGKALRDLTVGEAMTREVVTCSPAEDVVSAVTKMREHRVRRLPVTASGKLVGMLSLNDLANAMQNGHAAQDSVSLEQVAQTLAAICAHRLPVPMTPRTREAAAAHAH